MPNSDEFDDLFENLDPGYDTVMRRGKLLLDRTSKHGDTRLTVYEYNGEKYAMLWDVESGQNISYKTLEDMAAAHPAWRVLNTFMEG